MMGKTNLEHEPNIIPGRCILAKFGEDLTE